MGMFSFVTSDDKEPIYSDSHKRTVYMLDHLGNVFKESDYEGYGVFGGKDVFVCWMEANKPELCTNKSQQEIRDLFFSMPDEEAFDLVLIDSEHTKAIKFVHSERHTTNYDSLDYSGHHENQGWYCEEEEEEDYY